MVVELIASTVLGVCPVRPYRLQSLRGNIKASALTKNDLRGARQGPKGIISTRRITRSVC